MNLSTSHFASLLLCGSLASFSGCGRAPDPDAPQAALTAEQLAEHAREEAQVQDSERQQQKLVQRKPAGKK